MEDKADEAYAAWPERLYIAHKGKIVFKGGRGPEGYKPSEVDDWLSMHASKL